MRDDVGDGCPSASEVEVPGYVDGAGEGGEAGFELEEP